MTGLRNRRLAALTGRELETGDHYLTIGRVVDVASSPGRRPLFLFNGAFERLPAT